MSKRCGSSNTDSSKLADEYTSPARWPAFTSWPPTSASSSAVRWNMTTGVAQRTTSSAVVAGRSALYSSLLRGCSRRRACRG
ncbi:MAG: hypothetical protein R2702_01300 [Acidimicrobiales bacterium]